MQMNLYLKNKKFPNHDAVVEAFEQFMSSKEFSIFYLEMAIFFYLTLEKRRLKQMENILIK